MIVKIILLIFFGTVLKMLDWPRYGIYQIGNGLGHAMQALGFILIGVYIERERNDNGNK